MLLRIISSNYTPTRQGDEEPQLRLRVAVLAGAEVGGCYFAIIKARKRDANRRGAKQELRPVAVPTAAAPKPAAVFSPQKTEAEKGMTAGESVLLSFSHCLEKELSSEQLALWTIREMMLFSVLKKKPAAAGAAIISSWVRRGHLVVALGDGWIFYVFCGFLRAAGKRMLLRMRR